MDFTASSCEEMFTSALCWAVFCLIDGIISILRIVIRESLRFMESALIIAYYNKYKNKIQ